MNKSIVLLIVCFIISLSACKNNSNNTPATNTNDNQLDTIFTVESISKAIRENPKSADLFLRRAELRLLENNDRSKYIEVVNEAINDAEIALRIDSLRPETYVKIAEYNLLKGQSEPARDILVECLKIFPDNVEARIRLAYLYYYIEKYIDATKEINYLESKNIQNTDSYFLKGLIYDDTEMYDEAIKALKTAIEYDNNNWEAYSRLGIIYGSLDDKIAVEYFKTASRLFPNNLEIRYNAGVIFQKFGLFNEAEEEYKYVINADSLSTEPHHNLGIIYVNNLKDYDAAIKEFSTVIELDTLSYRAYYNRGYTYEVMKNYKMAESDYREALRIMPNYELAVEGLNYVIEKQYNK